MDENKPSSGANSNGDKDRRPRVTLELKATEIPDAQAQRQALPPPHADGGSNGNTGYAKRDERMDTDQRSRRSGFIAGLMTHTAAGLAGGVLALVAAFYGIEHFRDRMTALSGPTAEQIKAELRGINTKVSGLESGNAAGVREAVAETKAATQTLSSELEGLRGELAALSNKVSQSAPSESAAINPEMIKPLLAPLDAKLSSLEGKIAGLAQAQNTQRASVASTALAVAFNNLRRAVVDGKPFSSELEAVGRLGGGPEITALQPHKDDGIAPISKLQKDLDPLIRTALSAAREGEEGAFGSKLWAQVRSVVRIRPTGLVEGDTPDAVLARMETRIAAGDAAAAVKEAAALKGEQAVILQPWVSAAKARADADAALESMELRLLASLKAEGATQ